MPYTIAVDTGNKQIKTVHKTFSAGLVACEERPSFGQDVLLYGGKYYTISNSRIPYMRDKTEDDRYFILTLLALAYEMEQKGGVSGNDSYQVRLLAGLPPAHMGTMREKYQKYFKRTADIEFNGAPYSIQISDVVVYPQAYAAVAPMFSAVREMDKALVVDIGGYTADLLLLRNGQPDLSICDSLENGTIKFYNFVRSRLNSEYDLTVDESDIDSVLQGRNEILNEKVQMVIQEMAADYIADFLNHLRELQIDLKTYQVIFVGGGSLLFRPYLDRSDKLNRRLFNEDIAANAKGYETIYQASRMVSV